MKQRLSEFITLQRGFDLPASQRVLGEVPVVASTGIVACHNLAKVKAPGVVIGRSGSIGGGQFVEQDFWPLNTTLYVKDFKGNNPRYAYYALKTIDFSAFNAGAGVPTLNRNHIASIEIEVLPRPIQDRIAGILSDYDSAIANCRKQIALLEEAAMRLYREWFKDGKGEKGHISKWFDVTIGRTPARKIASYYSTNINDLKWCSIADIKSTNTFVFDTAEKLTRQAVDDSKIHISPAGSILLSFKLTVGRVAITADAMATNEAIAHFETNDRALRDYTYCYLHEFKYGTLGSTSSIGTAINSDIVRRMPYIKPADEVLKNFSEGVSPIFDSILMHGNQIRTLTEARDRLLPKLMKGEVAV